MMMMMLMIAVIIIIIIVIIKLVLIFIYVIVINYIGLKYYNKREKDKLSIVNVSNIPLIFSFRYKIACSQTIPMMPL